VPVAPVPGTKPVHPSDWRFRTPEMLALAALQEQDPQPKAEERKPVVAERKSEELWPLEAPGSA